MKRMLIILGIILLPALSYSQYRWEYGVGVGASNYLGDIGGGGTTTLGGFLTDMRFGNTRQQLYVFSRYKLNKAISLRASLMHVRASGSDDMDSNPERFGRNLSFKTNITELAVVGELTTYQQSRVSGKAGVLRGKKKRMDFRTFVFAGFGAIFFNPKATLGGQTYNLHSLQTEGVDYSRITYVIPVGLGLSYTLDRKIRISFDIGYRFTGTDYIDDVSSKYANISSTETIRYQLANRRPELGPNALTPDGKVVPNLLNYGYNTSENVGAKRGDPRYKDGYFVSSVSVGYVLKGKNAFYKAKQRTIINRRKVVKKKTKARF
jgi:hypothetical protein